MKRGFTILELLVASLLLGMLVSILTMIFNQSSIAWRTSVALTADLDDARNDLALIREEADNAFIANNQVHLLAGLWKADGSGLRTRACDMDGDVKTKQKIPDMTASATLSQFTSLSIGNDTASHNVRNYTVNVMSAGPDKEFDTWDDIWSFPDDPSEW